MNITFSDYFDIKGQMLDELGAFNPNLLMDTEMFINIILLRNTKVKEFTNSYDKIISRFGQLYDELKDLDNSNDFNRIVKGFDLSERKELCIGYAENINGKGSGSKIKTQIITDAKRIIDIGVDNPKLFLYMHLFKKNFGADRSSDMIANIIKEDIVAYTKRILSELGVNPQTRPDMIFNNKTGIPFNPCLKPRKVEIWFCPQSILHQLPLSKEYKDIFQIGHINQMLREHFEKMIGEDWYTRGSASLKEEISKYPKLMKEIIDKGEKIQVEEYNFLRDPKRIMSWIPEIKSHFLKNPPNREITEIDAKYIYEIGIELISYLSESIEINNLNNTILDAEGRIINETSVRRFVYIFIRQYCELVPGLNVKVIKNGSCTYYVLNKEKESTEKFALAVKNLRSGGIQKAYENFITRIPINSQRRGIFLLFDDLDNNTGEDRIKGILDLTKQMEKKLDIQEAPRIVFIDLLKGKSRKIGN